MKTDGTWPILHVFPSVSLSLALSMVLKHSNPVSSWTFLCLPTLLRDIYCYY